MAKIKLIINDVELELTNDGYSKSLSSVDSRNTSEAGTTLRAVTRTGIPSLDISYKCIETEEVKLETYSKQSSLLAQLLDESTGELISWRCFMDGFKSDLVVEDNNHRYYNVSFKLNDLEG